MSKTTVCLCANTIHYPWGGGHLWAYLNWALGLTSIGCRIVWLEILPPHQSIEETAANLHLLRNNLQPYGLADQIVILDTVHDSAQFSLVHSVSDLEEIVGWADLLLSFQYGMPQDVVRRFRRSAMIDIDPGLFQIWIHTQKRPVVCYDIYLTIGETIAQRCANVPLLGINWVYTPPCVALESWASSQAVGDAPFTTLAHWYASGGIDSDPESDDKRAGFLPFLDLPELVARPLELALDLDVDNKECKELRDRGWRIKNAHSIASTPWDYQSYIQRSFGEFSCAKPAYSKLQTSWLSDRTVCYLASGKPAVVQHTGPSQFLPDAAGIFRFNSKQEAVRYIDLIDKDYEHQCSLARNLAEEYFDAKKVVTRVLESALS